MPVVQAEVFYVLHGGSSASPELYLIFSLAVTLSSYSRENKTK
jgi:hypothetical protein